MQQAAAAVTLTIVNPIAEPRELAQGADRFPPAEAVGQKANPVHSWRP